MKIGIILENLKTDYQSALEIVQSLEVDGVQFCGNYFKPQSCGINISAICAEIDGKGFEEYNKERISKTKEIMLQAKHLNCKIVTTHIGVIELDNMKMKSAIEEIGCFGDEIGVSFAIETGPEKCTTLKTFIDSLKCRSVGVNFDPANLVMVTDDDPVKGVYTLRDYIFHVHIKDGVMIKKTNPKIIYDFFAEGGIGNLKLDEYFKETPLGKGSVDLHGVVKALKDIGYDGFLTIERETGKDSIEEIKNSIIYTRSLVS